MAVKVERWLANDGMLFNTEIEANRHEFGKPCFDCPCCKGVGKVNGEPRMESVYDPDLTAHSGSWTPMYSKKQVGWIQQVCAVCNGKGFTRVEKKAITETVVVGYK